jgi:hypothetical protein
MSLHGHVSQEGGWDTGAGISSSNWSNRKILIENPQGSKADQKILEKSEFGESALTEKYTQLLFI